MELKKIICKWQTELEGKAWNSIFWGNHDQPRAVTRFGDDRPEYREISAKMLATCLLSLQGTPYIYQGDELGMTNAYFDDINSYRDIESIHCFHEFTEAGLISEEEMMECLKLRGRDNSRTPMQWDDSLNAGFTKGTPWIRINENYPEINVQAEMEDEHSVLNYYKRMIQIRKAEQGLIYGEFIPVEPEHASLFAYKRILENDRYLVVCNFTDQAAEISLPEEFSGGRILISNMDDRYDAEKVRITRVKPYEAFIIKA